MKIKKLLTICTLPLFILACGESKTATDVKQTANAGQSVPDEQAKIKKVFEEVKGLNSFKTGNMMAANQAYVLFDPQCPHCAKLWAETKKINGLSVNWIPVGFLNQKSTQQGAVIISSPDAAKLMNVHEELLSNNLGGMVTENVPAEGIKKITQNTEFFKNNFDSVPVMIYQNSKTKEYGIIGGSVPKETIIDKLGLPS